MSAVLQMPKKHTFNYRRLRKLRLARGWTETDLASRVGVTATTIRNWESGASPPKLLAYADLCIALGLDMEELLVLAK